MEIGESGAWAACLTRHYHTTGPNRKIGLDPDLGELGGPASDVACPRFSPAFAAFSRIFLSIINYVWRLHGITFPCKKESIMGLRRLLLAGFEPGLAGFEPGLAGFEPGLAGFEPGLAGFIEAAFVSPFHHLVPTLCVERTALDALRPGCRSMPGTVTGTQSVALVVLHNYEITKLPRSHALRRAWERGGFALFSRENPQQAATTSFPI